MTARHFYDVALPAVPGLEASRGYTLLLRVLNAQGVPVSEEQQLRFEWTGEELEDAPPHCWRQTPIRPPPGEQTPIRPPPGERAVDAPALDG